MNEPVERMKALMDSLPKKDIPIGFAYLEHRDFESLQDLIDSAIIRTKNNIHSDNIIEEYTSVNLDNLRKLKAEVDAYSMQINRFYIDINDFDENNYEEEFY